jgi:hypothetical protein
LTHAATGRGGIAINDCFYFCCCSSLCVEANSNKEFEAISSILVKTEAVRAFQAAGLKKRVNERFRQKTQGNEYKILELNKLTNCIFEMASSMFVPSWKL